MAMMSERKMGFFTFEKCFLLIWLFCVRYTCVYTMVVLWWLFSSVLVYCKVSNGRLRTFISCLNALVFSIRYIYRNRTMSFANILFKFLPPSMTFMYLLVVCTLQNAISVRVGWTFFTISYYRKRIYRFLCIYSKSVYKIYTSLFGSLFSRFPNCLFKIGVSITCDLNDENKWTLPIRFNLTIANMEILNSKLLIRLCKLYYRWNDKISLSPGIKKTILWKRFFSSSFCFPQISIDASDIVSCMLYNVHSNVLHKSRRTQIEYYSVLLGNCGRK